MRKWLVQLRLQKNITQVEMAKKLDISQSYYAQIESGERCKKLTIDMVDKLSKIFKISLAKIRNFEATG